MNDSNEAPAPACRSIEPHVPFLAGQVVEVVDVGNRFDKRVGTIAFLVGDNIYVKFPGGRWSPSKMFFPDQLRAIETVADAATPGNHRH